MLASGPAKQDKSFVNPWHPYEAQEWIHFFSIFSFFFPSFWFTSLADWHRLALGDIRRYAVELFFVGRCYLDQRKRVSFSFFLSVGWLVALSEAIGMNVLRHGEYVDTRAFSAKKGTTF